MTDQPAETTCKTACPYCGVGCGVIATVGGGGQISVKGDPDHPANFGRLCSKGTSLGETVGLEDRLLHPSIAGTRVYWDQALDEVASKFRAAIDEHGPDSVAFYVSGQLLTEDYYVANKLMKGFIGSANIDTNSRLCMASSVAGHKRAFGSDTVPGLYEDLESADLIVLVGSNLAWCHPVLYQRIEAARAKSGMRTIVIDPRRTATADTADLHLPLDPGSDVALFNGLFHWLNEKGAIDDAYVDAHTQGFAEALAASEGSNLRTVAERTGLDLSQLVAFYDAFLKTEKVVTVYSQGVNQSTAGTDKVNAILNCHLATGRIGRPGMGPFSVTGQPNAMGGRETGGLANQLAAHMDLDNARHREIVRDFWQAPALPFEGGLKAVDLFDAVEKGQIKALWIMATNPAVSLPDADRVRDAIAKCDFVAVSDVTMRTDTVDHAHVLLPALAWGEKDGMVTNSERRMSRQRPFLPAPGEAKGDWWIMCEVAKRMGYAGAFDFASPADVFREYAAMTGFRNEGARDLDISAFEDISDAAFDAFEPTLWPQPKSGEARERFFADGGFYTPTGKARFLSIQDRTPAALPTAEFPFVLNTGRIRDQWHTMTRTGVSPQLSQHLSEPFVEVHPLDADKLGLEAADLARLESPTGTCVLRVLVTDRVAKGHLFVPMHWNAQWASHGRIDSLIGAHVDPVSGQPESKCAPVRIEKYQASWFALAVSANRPTAPEGSYWALAAAPQGWRMELAGEETVTDWVQWAAALFPNGVDQDVNILVTDDKAAGIHRSAIFKGDVLVAALITSSEPVEASRAWLAKQIGAAVPDMADKASILAGRPAADRPDPGATVCSCFSVGANDIRRAIVDQGCATVEAVGACTGAGTNCGSCRAEIEVMISHAVFQEAS